MTEQAWPPSRLTSYWYSLQVFPMGVLKRAVPWWSLPLNWLVGEPTARFLSPTKKKANKMPELCN